MGGGGREFQRSSSVKSNEIEKRTVMRRIHFNVVLLYCKIVLQLITVRYDP